MAQKMEDKAKITTKDAGDATVGKGAASPVVLGVLAGIVYGEIVRKIPTGGSYSGLKGAFRMTPASEELPIVRASVCYLPEALQAAIFEKHHEPETVRFAFEISTAKSDNSDGYAITYKPLVEITAADPLGELLAQIEAAPEPAPKKVK